jgi:hypothetical protein
MLHSEITGYGGAKESIIGVTVLLVSVVLFLYRRLGQDHAKVELREAAPSVPPG